jgi:N-acetylglutamate synthase-like GNAT family acetyltransferase
MKIRLANKFDIPELKRMLWNYHDSGSIKGLDVTNEEAGLRILTMILIGGGMALVAEKEPGQLVGMLLAVKVPFLWDNTKMIMNEIAYWVDTEHRGGTAGYRLLQKYTELCDELKGSDKLFSYTISQMNGQNLDYSRFGFRPIETTWSV